MGVKVAVLDLDGTLADTIVDISAAIEQVISKYGVFTGLEEMSRMYIGNGGFVLMERIYDALTIDKTGIEEDYEEYKRLYAENSCVKTTLYPGVEAFLEGLEARGIQMVMATHKPKLATEQLVDGLGIRGYFERVFSYEDLEEPKPNPWCVEESARLCGAAPSECIMVGDSMTDVGAGIAAGAVSVAMMNGYEDQAVMENCNAHYKVNGALEILDIIDTLNRTEG